MSKPKKNNFGKLFMIATMLVCFAYLMFPQKEDEKASPEATTPQEQSQPQAATPPEKVIEEDPPEKTITATKTPEKVEEELPTLEDTPKVAETKPDKPAPTAYPAGKTVDEAWGTLVQLWFYNPKGCDFGIYTEMGKFVFERSGKKSHNYFKHDPSIYVDKPYTVMTKGDYAVVNFKEPEHNENLPIFFYKTEEGWKFDLVHQRKLVRFGDLSYCGIEKYISPYSAITRKFPSYSGIDIPVEENDIYKLSEDVALTNEIKEQEQLYLSGKLTYEKAINLARLYSITTLGSKAIPLLKTIEKILPENPDVHKYMAISHVESDYNYKSAQKSIEKYIKLLPDSAYGHNFMAYLYLNSSKYGEAEAEFSKNLELHPENCYTSAKLTQIYGRMQQNLSDENADKAVYKKKYDEMFANAGKCCKNGDYERFIWLIQWKHSQN